MKTKVLKLADIREEVFVRRHLDRDRVEYFADLYTGNGVVQLIKVTEEGVLFDGRHRKAALEMLEAKEILCEIVPSCGQADLIEGAFAANLGGALPPSTSDIVFAVRQLFEAGLSHSKVSERMKKHFPLAVVRRYIADAITEMNKAKLRAAVKAVANDGLRVEEAAETHGVEVSKLREEIGGNKKEVKKFDMGLVKAGITTQTKSNSSKTAAMLKKLIERWEEGQLNTHQVLEVFEHIKAAQKRAVKSISNQRKRFEVLANPPAPAKSKEEAAA